MNLTERRERYRAILAEERCVYAASVFDPISARIAEDLGFEVGLLASSVASATILGAPDLAVLTLTEFADQARRICRASSISLMVDADNGYGNALNVRRTVEELETAGVAALTIDDTLLPQGFGEAKGWVARLQQKLISLEEGVGKMKAALAGRQDPSLVIVGSTGALRIEGLAETIRRGEAYERAGVDALYLRGGKVTREEVATVHAAIRIPLLLGGAIGEHAAESFLGANGVRIASFSAVGHSPFQAAVKAVYDTLKALRDGVSPAELRPHLASPELLAQGTRQADYNRWIGEYLN